MSCKYVCHVVKGLIHFGIATETPKGTKNKHQSLMGIICQVNVALQICTRINKYPTCTSSFHLDTLNIMANLDSPFN